MHWLLLVLFKIPINHRDCKIINLQQPRLPSHKFRNYLLLTEEVPHHYLQPCATLYMAEFPSRKGGSRQPESYWVSYFKLRKRCHGCCYSVPLPNVCGRCRLQGVAARCLWPSALWGLRAGAPAAECCRRWYQTLPSRPQTRQLAVAPAHGWAAGSPLRSPSWTSHRTISGSLTSFPRSIGTSTKNTWVMSQGGVLRRVLLDSALTCDFAPKKETGRS